jgi:HEAT repeat protein
VCAAGFLFEGSAVAQPIPIKTLQDYGVKLDGRGVEGAFNDRKKPAQFAHDKEPYLALLAVLRSGSSRDQTQAAYAFGVLNDGWPGSSPQDVRADALLALIQMMSSPDTRARVAAGRVTGRLLYENWNQGHTDYLVVGVVEALLALLSQQSESEQLAAMEALGLIRARTAGATLTERYNYYRKTNQRTLAGGALEALARLNDPAGAPIVQQLLTDKWAAGNDATALVVVYARIRLLGDSAAHAVLVKALKDKSRRVQATMYLEELVPVLH